MVHKNIHLETQGIRGGITIVYMSSCPDGLFRSLDSLMNNQTFINKIRLFLQ